MAPTSAPASRAVSSGRHTRLSAKLLQPEREREQRVTRPAATALEPLSVRSLAPRRTIPRHYDRRINLARATRDAHQPPAGRLGGHRGAPALGEHLGCHGRKSRTFVRVRTRECVADYVLAR